jgi:hypothetical protein
MVNGGKRLASAFGTLLTLALVHAPVLIESKIVTKEVQAATRWREIGLIRG